MAEHLSPSVAAALTVADISPSKIGPTRHAELSSSEREL